MYVYMDYFICLYFYSAYFMIAAILGLNDIYYQNEPDLTYYCSTCQRFIVLLSLRAHKAYHSALDLLQFEKCPPSTSELLSRRNQVVRKLKVCLSAHGLSSCCMI